MSGMLMAQNTIISTDSTTRPEVMLGEVIIEASRDDSKNKEIPSAITSISGVQIKRNQINSLEDAAAFAPNFMMLDYGTKIMSPVYIRGVGSKKNSPSVGMYVDGIPYYDNSALSFDFYDLHSLEILRGPQGTLYGRNTIGGLININTLSPLDYQGTNVRLTAAQYENYNGTVSHYGQVGKLAYSLAGNVAHNGGYFTNAYDSSMTDNMTSYGLRNRLIYEASDNLSFENIFSFEQSTQGGYPYGLLDSMGIAQDPNYNEPSSYERMLLNEGLKASYEANKYIAEGIFSYQHINDRQLIDQDFTPSPIYIFEQQQIQNMYSFEGTIRSKDTQSYKWQAGAFVFKHQLDKDLDATLRSDPYYTKTYNQSMVSTGLFFQSEIDLTDRLKMTQGLRLNYENSGMDFTFDEHSGGNSITVADTSYQKLEEFIVLPKLALTYNFDKTALYASYTTGYKPGGYNSTFETSEQVTFENEMSHNYELGIKSDLLDGILFTEMALFLTNIKGQQFLRSVESSTGTYLDNTGESVNKGFEFSLNSRPVSGFSANVAYGFTHSEMTSYIKNDSVNYNGNISPYVPRHTLNITLHQSIKTDFIDFIDRINAQVNFKQIGEMYWNVENTLKEDSYGILNAQLSLVYHNFNIDIWGKNILDQKYNAYVFSMSAGPYGQSGPPTRFGTTLSVNF